VRHSAGTWRRRGKSAEALRIALVCDWFLKWAAPQAGGLVGAGAEVLLLCRTHAHEFGGDADERASVLEAAQAAGVRVIEVPGRLSDPRVALALGRVHRQIRSFSPQLVHAHDGADPRLLPMLARVPTVLSLHDPVPHPGQPVPAARKRWFLHGSRDMWRDRAAVIVVHSERLRGEITLGASQRCAAIPLGLHVEPSPLPPPAQPAVGFFGRLVPYKGLEVLARAMPKVWDERPDVQLQVRGAGDCPVPLSDRRATVDRRYLPESELAGFFGSLSIVVLPYTQASQTAVGGVAAGYGVPAVVSDAGGLADLTLDPTYVVQAGDDAQLAGAILAHIDDGAAVRDRVLREIAAPRSWEAVAAQSLELYGRVLRARR
jgi:glycosyltransferase involved in cell wall biosynthesis